LQELFKPRNRNLVLAYIGDGIQAITLSAIWPLFVFILLKEKYTALGLITALTLLVILVLRLITGSLFDKWNKSKLIIIGAALASSGWLLKILVATPFQVFAADTYHGMGRTVNRTSVDAMTYEQSADNGRYVDEYTTLKEMSLATGRVLMLAFTALIVLYFGLNTAFIAALVISAGATLATILLKERVKLR
jgi:MFS family permease